MRRSVRSAVRAFRHLGLPIPGAAQEALDQPVPAYRWAQQQSAHPENYFDDRERGWFWYEDPAAKAERGT